MLKVTYLNNLSNLKNKIINVEDGLNLNQCIEIINVNHKLFLPSFEIVNSGTPTHIFQINGEGFGEIISIN